MEKIQTNGSKNKYEKTTEWIFSLKRLGDINYQLDCIKELLNLIGNPQKKLKVIHIGGTNGKGSTVTIISSILKEAGYKVGTFTKPHMSNFTERISINGEQISEDVVVKMIEDMKPAIEKVAKKYYHPTFFEITTALMFKYFQEKNVDYAVIEVGIGGRLDATNTTNTIASAITNISLEHTKLLGNTIEKIAIEKAGIIKNDGLFLTTATQDSVLKIFDKISKTKKTKFIKIGDNQDVEFKIKSMDKKGQIFDLKTTKRHYENLEINLLGKHQVSNASLAISLLDAIPEDELYIDEKIIRKSLKKIKWPGRLEILQEHPTVLIDGAKDMLASLRLAENIKDLFGEEKINLVVSISKGKKSKQMLKHLLPITKQIFIAEHKVNNRAIKTRFLAKEIEDIIKDSSFEKIKITEIKDVKKATKKAIETAGEDGIILVTGSIFTIGEAREIWHKKVDYFWGREMNEM